MIFIAGWFLIGVLLKSEEISNLGEVTEYSASFDDISGNWIQLGADIDGEVPGDRSGYSVSLSSDGNTVAIGAKFNDENGHKNMFN